MKPPVVPGVGLYLCVMGTPLLDKVVVRQILNGMKHVTLSDT